MTHRQRDREDSHRVTNHHWLTPRYLTAMHTNTHTHKTTSKSGLCAAAYLTCSSALLPRNISTTHINLFQSSWTLWAKLSLLIFIFIINTNYFHLLHCKIRLHALWPHTSCRDNMLTCLSLLPSCCLFCLSLSIVCCFYFPFLQLFIMDCY